MGSTFSGIEISKSGLNVHQTALNTTGHNISNADNKQYARQRVALRSAEPIYNPSLNRSSGPGQLGQGAMVAEIQRIRHHFYDDQIMSTETAKNYWGARQLYFKQMENVFNEPSDNTLRSLTDKFWSSWQELANFPAEMAHREVVLERGRALVTRIQDSYEKLHRLRQRANNEIETEVEKLNSLATEIRDLNERISKSEALGDQANDLKDRRDAVLEKMSGIANINIGRGDRDELIVFIGEQALVQGEIQRKLKTQADPENEGMARIFWEHNDRGVVLKNGHLHGLLEMRDIELVDRITDIDSYAVNIADIVNEAHRDGFGIDGSTNKNFFHIRPLSRNVEGTFVIQNEVGDYDIDQDGVNELSAIFRVTGTHKIDPEARLGISGALSFFNNNSENTLVNISYREDDTLQDVVKRINDRKTGVVAYINHDKQLALKATRAEDDKRTNFMIRHIEDSGDLLVGQTGILTASGAEGAFDYRRTGGILKLRSSLQDISLTPNFHPAANLEIANAIAQNPAAIAAGGGKDIGGTGDYNTANGANDGRHALIIAAALKQDSRMLGHSKNPEEFYNALIGELGIESRVAEDATVRLKSDLLYLNNLRQSVMGVNLDEEMSNMIQFQHAYNASARMLQTQNELLGIIINRLGA